MPTSWNLQRGYASHVRPGKFANPPLIPDTYPLKLEPGFRDVLDHAISAMARHPMSSVAFRMSDDREHPVRELLLKLAFGQTRTPLAAVLDLAARLAQHTDRRTGSSLMLTTVEESGDKRRVSLYLFPEEDTFRLKTVKDEAVLERLQAFVLKSKLRKVARFEGKNIKSHFILGGVADLIIGSDPRTAADYWVAEFLDADFAINSIKGTRLVAEGLKRAFERAEPLEKQSVMEAAISIIANRRQAWTLERIGKTLLPANLAHVFCSVADNTETRTSQFMLDKDLLRNRINYRVFQLETGVWVSSPFSEVGETVKVSGTAEKRTLTCNGRIISEKVRSDKARP